LVQEVRVTTSDDSKVSEDRREALRYAFAIGSGAALASALVSPASAQATPDNTLDRIRANKVLRIAVLPGELPYFNNRDQRLPLRIRKEAAPNHEP
jgi:polar amino acid transport system substrate-binding protein